ncbi:hypothetical protein RFI_15670 [Reticulomyxa filosa]|uniref:Uncharacterized protein n=1 Tax=Reticulomyxa filosa TaxID=46433 RepID=X6N8A9_RETFI|nr:hypothetical protein RFI_15670 [Reticulomyxa filosa]|eukprot:ETO21537.1 hypothetical protein RFI_15670 [Reticulomyxa filosa]
MALNILSLIGIAILLLFIYQKFLKNSSKNPSVAILVVGDVGRSPRMQRHTISCLQELPTKYEVHLVGFFDSSLMSDLTSEMKNKNTRLHCHPIWRFPLKPRQTPHFLVYALCKILTEFISLHILLLNPKIIPNLHYMVLQNPPTIPVALIAKIVCMIRKCKFVIDWHNFGFSILNVKSSSAQTNKSKGKKNIIVEIYRNFERYIGGCADQHLCVSEAMRYFLVEQWHFPSSNMHVLYDRPTDLFLSKLTIEKKKQLDQDLFQQLAKHLLVQHTDTSAISDLKGRDFWVITSTSWTPDEDISMLWSEHVLDTVHSKLADTRIHHDKRRLVIFITGKDEGELKQEFEKNWRAIESKMTNVRVVLLWLERYELYVHLLRWCDIGLCFHRSSSGLDLPMKVVDMFGIGIPVIAYEFDEQNMRRVMKWHVDDKNTEKHIQTALPELVSHGKHGLVFSNSSDLTQHLCTCFDPTYLHTLNEFRQNIETDFRSKSWETDWREIVKPILCSSNQ